MKKGPLSFNVLTLSRPGVKDNGTLRGGGGIYAPPSISSILGIWELKFCPNVHKELIGHDLSLKLATITVKLPRGVDVKKARVGV